MSELKEILRKEIPEFREVGHEFLEKKITVMEFKGKSGGMGMYAQRGGQHFMVRLRMQCGVLSLDNFKLAYDYAKKYNLKTLHFTTRQTIQLHYLGFDEVCDIMESAMEFDVFTRGGGGNYPRNVSLSPLAGVACDEVFDTTEHALMVDNHFMSKITTYNLPRKLKVAFSNSEKDTGAATINDLGFMAVVKDNKPYYKLYIAGGLGNNPAKAVEYDELIEPKDVLYHVEAMTELFKAEGNYENKAKARSRYIVARMGEEEFLKCYKKHYEAIKSSMKLEELPTPVINENITCDCDIDDNTTVIKQRQEGLYTVILHPLNGHMQITDVENLIEFLKGCDNVELRISMCESLYVRNLTKENVDKLVELSKAYNETVAIAKSNCCVGIPTCQMGIAHTQDTMINIINHLKEKDMLVEYLPKLHISGCNNSCARQQVAELGLSGKKKRVGDVTEDAYEVYVGGQLGKGITKLGEQCGAILNKDLPQFIYELACKLKENKTYFKDYINNNKEEFIQLVDKYKVG